MKYNELTMTRQKKSKRAGRGISAGRGKTAGRGTKGQGARKSPQKAGFEGGQMPLYMRLPKLRGFKSYKKPAINVYTGQLDQVKKPVVDATALHEAGLINDPHANIKLLVRGDVSSKKQVKLQTASQKAVEALEKAGGSFEAVGRLPRPSKKADKKSE